MEQINENKKYTGIVSRKPRRLKKQPNPTIQTLRDNTFNSTTVNNNNINNKEQDLETIIGLLEYQFVTPPARQQCIFQICDIRDTKIQKIVKQSSITTCDVCI